MCERHSSRPVVFFLLVLPYGIAGGFVAITLPFLLTQAGFPVALSASIVAIGASANIWRFFWGPVADLTFTLRHWYAVGLTVCALALLMISFMPLRQDAVGLLMAMVFLSQVAATFVVLPVGGLMAHTVAEQEKGRAGGWYQAGNLGGAGLGGGAGVWLASHFSPQTAGVVLSAAMAVSAAALYFVPNVRGSRAEALGQRVRAIGRDFREMLTWPPAVLTIVLVASPIGVGAASNLWPAIAPEWKTTPDTVALITGLLSGVASAVGCVCGGRIADRVGRWWAFLGSGSFIAVVALLLAAAPRTPAVYCTGVLFYAFSGGLAYAAFSAIVLYAIGRGAASTKYATLSSLGNVPVVYMTAFDGWIHDRSGSRVMLVAEAALGVVCVLLGLLALRRIRASGATRNAPPYRSNNGQPPNIGVRDF